MKHADLKLDTVYADRDGFPVVVVTLDKSATGLAGFERTIRPKRDSDRSYGVIVVSKRERLDPTPDGLCAKAAWLRENPPDRESYGATFEVRVAKLSSIIRTWDEHIIKTQEETVERERSLLTARELVAHRAAQIARIAALLPDGVFIKAEPGRDWATITLDDLLTVLEGRTPAT